MTEDDRLREYAAGGGAESPALPDTVGRLREFGRRVAGLREGRLGTTASVARYGARARGQIAADARGRWATLAYNAGATRLMDGFAPSLAHLAELTLDDEPRFSLLLASLLDPVRAPMVAERLWPALFARLLSRSDPNKRPRLQASLACWAPELLGSLTVDPRSYGAEWEHLDVFARVVDATGLRFAAVIENKIRPDTDEQGRQLARYHELIADRFGAVDRTLFVFLTEGDRPMKTAEGTALDWHPLFWADVASALAEVAEALSGGWAALAHSARDAIRSEILGLPSAEHARRRLVAVHAEAGRAANDTDWARLHPAILDLNRELEDLR
jgi:hypothetical protein